MSTKKEVARKNTRKSSPPVPTISLRTEEERLLAAISKKKGFNINNYSDNFEIARSTTRSRLKKLDRIGLISYKFADVNIKKTGKIYLENIEKQRHESSRKGARKVAKKHELSAHWHKFYFEIIDRKKFRKERLDLLKCSWKENKGMKNWSELIATFDDATITIKPKTLVLELKDLVANNTSEVDSKCLRRMMEYSELLNSLGLKLGETTIERGHWARVDSLLADVIYKKIGEKYYLLDTDGTRIFWIDFSPDKTGKRHKEDEVPDKLARENLDYNIDQQLNKKINFDRIDLNEMTIDEIKESLGMVAQDLTKITTIEKIRLEETIEKSKLERFKLENKQKESNQDITPQPILGYIG